MDRRGSESLTNGVNGVDPFRLPVWDPRDPPRDGWKPWVIRSDTAVCDVLAL